MVSVKPRSSSNGVLASCTMMTLRPAPYAPRFGKELTHPTYDYVALKARTAAVEGQRVARDEAHHLSA
jgi:hypothetical protein